MADDRVTLTLDDDGVAQVRLNRPDKLNALDPAMFDAIVAVGEELRTLKGLRAVVLAGEGRAFCAGLDLTSFAAGGSDPTRALSERTHGNANRPQEAAMTWRKCPVPVIAAMHGVCFGGGLQIASGADIRMVHPETRDGDHGDAVGPGARHGRLRAVARAGARRCPARTCLLQPRILWERKRVGLGLATFVEADPLARAQAIAAEIANRNPESVRGAKRLFDVMDDEAHRRHPARREPRARRRDPPPQPARGGDGGHAETRAQLHGLIGSRSTAAQGPQGARLRPEGVGKLNASAENRGGLPDHHQSAIGIPQPQPLARVAEIGVVAGGFGQPPAVARLGFGIEDVEAPVDRAQRAAAAS